VVGGDRRGQGPGTTGRGEYRRDTASMLPTAETVTNALRDLLPAYMIPSTIEVLDGLPLTGNGKLDRTAIAAVLDGAGPGGDDRVEPADDLERALLAIIIDVLDADPGQIGVADDFFAVGGDSVLATAVVARAREWLDAPQIGVIDIFTARTVRELALRVDAADEQPGRLYRVAAIYLEVAAMDAAELADAVTGAHS
ncbi:MAG: phosphopantetheine-binding protein, partial [Actinomycetota bacterium]|nr:phosphopantetheine-binding protein [Actinomycetota bacterium]